jgi:16S rRNA U516 pseudouridylate synthase RsuA-like enzyme
MERQTKTCSWLLVTLIEGRHHQIKEMFDRVGHPVLCIKRIAMGPHRLSNLRLGDIRPLTTKEIQQLRKAVNMPDTGR